MQDWENRFQTGLEPLAGGIPIEVDLTLPSHRSTPNLTPEVSGKNTEETQKKKLEGGMQTWGVNKALSKRSEIFEAFSTISSAFRTISTGYKIVNFCLDSPQCSDAIVSDIQAMLDLGITTNLAPP